MASSPRRLRLSRTSRRAGRSNQRARRHPRRRLPDQRRRGRRPPRRPAPDRARAWRRSGCWSWGQTGRPRPARARAKSLAESRTTARRPVCLGRQRGPPSRNWTRRWSLAGERRRAGPRRFSTRRDRRGPPSRGLLRRRTPRASAVGRLCLSRRRQRCRREVRRRRLRRARSPPRPGLRFHRPHRFRRPRPPHRPHRPRRPPPRRPLAPRAAARARSPRSRCRAAEQPRQSAVWRGRAGGTWRSAGGLRRAESWIRRR